MLVLSSCHSQDKKSNTEIIKSISFSTVGGELGYNRTFKMTADSLYFYFNLAVDSTKKRNEKRVNNNYKLEDIIQAEQLISFSKIMNGQSRQPIDGTDTEIKIETSRNTYSVINGEDNETWEGIKMKMHKILVSEFKTD